MTIHDANVAHQGSIGRFWKNLVSLSNAFLPTPMTLRDGWTVSRAGVSIRQPRFPLQRYRDSGDTYSAVVKLGLELTRRDETREASIRLGEVPVLSERGTFLIGGRERIPVAQLRRRPGLHLTRRETSDAGAVLTALLQPELGPQIRLGVPESGREKCSVRVAVGNVADAPLSMVVGRTQLLWDGIAALQRAGIASAYELEATAGESDDVEVLAAILSGWASDSERWPRWVWSVARAAHTDARGARTDGRARFNQRVRDLAHEVGLARQDTTQPHPHDFALALGALLRSHGPVYDDPADLETRRVWLAGDHLLEAVHRAFVGSYAAETRAARGTKDHGRLSPGRRASRPTPAAESAGSVSIAGDDLASALRSAGVTPKRADDGDARARPARSTCLREILIQESSAAANIDRFLASVETRGASTFASAMRRYLYSNLCQPIDDTNPLSEVSHKRTVTMLGSGALFERRGHVDRRTVHASHVGRLCPLETPESEIIGLRLHFASRAGVDSDGQIVAGGTADPGEDDPHRHQLGIAASLIPFIAHDELARASMGAKNMKQAVPLLKAEPPLIRTGMESRVADLSGCVISAPAAGRVVRLGDSTIQLGRSRHLPYEPLRASRHATLRWQRPIVSQGARVERGQPLVDTAAIVNGELALGVNLLVAYMPYHGYNFEDGIVISDRLVHEDVLTSVHAWERNFDLRGDESALWVEKEGREVGPGSLLLKRESSKLGRRITEDLTLDELIRGRIARVSRTTRQHGSTLDAGTVRETVRLTILSERKVQVGDKLTGRHGNKGVVTKIVPMKDMPHLVDGTPIDVLLNPHGVVSRMNLGQLLETHWGRVARRLGCRFEAAAFERVRLVAQTHPSSVKGGDRGLDDVWNAVAGELGFGGSAAGERQPASRARVAQVLSESASDEAALCRLLKMGNPKWAGAAGAHKAKAVLIDGMTGTRYLQPVVVGTQYFMKLNHMVEDKVHARADGSHAGDFRGRAPMTAQPLKGRRRGGGQRVGEMEVWALEAHQCFETLRELLSVHSDASYDERRSFMKDGALNPRLAESFRLLAILLRGMGLKLEARRREQEKWEQPWTYPGKVLQRDIAAVRLSLGGGSDFRDWARDAGGTVVTVTDSRVFNGKRWFLNVCPVHGPVGWSDRAARIGCPEGECSAKVRRVSYLWRVPSELGLLNKQGFPGNPREAGWRARFAVIPLCSPVSHPVGGKPIDCIPVIPPDFRWFGGQEGTRPWLSDLHRLYVSVLRANQRLKDAQDAHDDRLVNDALKRLQKAVTELFLSGHRDRKTGMRVRSIADLIKGKEGVLRKGLLGKRIDYSARSVIVVDPSLALDEVRLPETMARVLASGLAADDEAAPTVDRTRELLADKIVLINRAPSLHRYSVLAARPRLGPEDTIGLNPLVCGSLNADFDGDTMAVYLPLMDRSQDEARQRMLPSRHPVSTANGELLLHLTQDIVSGAYLASLRGSLDPDLRPSAGPLNKKSLTQHLLELYWNCDPEQRASLISDIAVRLVRSAFETITSEGLTFGIFDVPCVDRRKRLSALTKRAGRSGYESIDGLLSAYAKGQNGARRVVGDWLVQLQAELLARLNQNDQTPGSSPANPLAVMVGTGARGDGGTLQQMGGARGPIESGQGAVLGPVLGNFREGLSPEEFFVSAFGARRTLIDKKLVTGDAGYITRQIVEAAYPLTILQEDCGTSEGILLRPFDDPRLPSLSTRLMGRVKAGEATALRATDAEHEASAAPSVTVRSPITCQAGSGLCQRCYGWDPATRDWPEIGLPVGIVAGQSIGERGTQLTMRTFHSGGIVTDQITAALPRMQQFLHGVVRMHFVDGHWEWAHITDHPVRYPYEVSRSEDGLVATERMPLKDAETRLGRSRFTEAFLWDLHRLYQGKVDQRHLEILIRALTGFPLEDRPTYSAAAAVMSQPGFLAQASFRDALRVLLKAQGGALEDAFMGLKSQVILGSPARGGA